MKKLLTLAALALMAGIITAQNPQWVHFSKFDYINAFAEEGDIVWIGSESGLVKYNKISGNSTYYNQFNSGLPSNRIFAIAIETNGVKWIGTTEGLTSFDGTNWTTYNEANTGLPLNVLHIAIDTNNVKWIATAYNYWDPQPGTPGLTSFDGLNWTNYNTENSDIPSNQIKAISIDKEGLIWVATNWYGIGVFNGVSWQVYNESNSELYSNNVINLTIDTDNTKWIALPTKLMSFNNNTWSLWDKFSYCENVRALSCDRNGKIWISGYYLEAFDGITFASYDPSNSGLAVYGGPRDCIRTIMSDQNGTKWIGDGDEGLITFDDDIWERPDISNCGLPSDYISSIVIDGETKWFGTYDGLVSFNSQGWTTYDTANSPLPVNLISVLHIDKEGTMWIGTMGGGLVAVKGEKWQIYNKTNSGLSSNYVEHITSDINGVLWIAGYDYLQSFDGENWKTYDQINIGEDGFTTIAVDSNATMWLGTGDYNSGLTEFDGININTYTTSNSGLPDDYVREIKMDDKGIKWIATPSGLTLFDGTSWVTYNPDNCGMKFPYVNSIAFGNDLTWVTMEYLTCATDLPGGLASFDGKTWTSCDFDNFSPTSVAVDNDGTVWVGTYTGLIAYNANGVPFSITENPLHKKPLKIYPNPSTSKVTVEAPDDGTLTIFNLNGQLIHEQVVKAGSTSFDVSSLPAGMYVWRFIGGANVQNIKFVKP